jgi:hypothetical protein
MTLKDLPSVDGVDRVTIAAGCRAGPRGNFGAAQIRDVRRVVRARLPLRDDTGEAMAWRKAAHVQAAVDAVGPHWAGLANRPRGTSGAGPGCLAISTLTAGRAGKPVFAIAPRATRDHEPEQGTCGQHTK